MNEEEIVEQEPEQPGVGTGEGGNPNSDGNGMTFDEWLDSNPAFRSEFDRRNTKAVQTARTKWEREQADNQDEARKLENMTAAQRERYQLNKDKAALERDRQTFAAQQLQVAVGAELQKRGLSADFAPYLTGADADESTQRIDAFERLWNQAHQERVDSQMRGGKPPKDPKPSGLTRDQIKTMSPAEINARWDEIQNVLKGE